MSNHEVKPGSDTPPTSPAQPNPCKFCDRMHEGIGGHYDRIRCKVGAVSETIKVATWADVPRSIIKRIEDWRDQVGDTGD